MQVRGKKNLVIEKSLAGPVGVFVKFSTLQDYGVDKVFFLETDNVDASQKSVIFLARGEKASQCIAIAGKYMLEHSQVRECSGLCFGFFNAPILPLGYFTFFESTYNGTKSRSRR